jgi:hypothetical protein
MKTRNEWLKNHKSANFFWSIIVVGILLLAVGLAIGQSTSKVLGFLSTFIIQLSGAAFATAILTVFLSFRDIRQTLSNTLSDLWTEGNVVNSLSSKVKEKIDKKIILSSNENSIISLEETLYRSLTEQRINCLNSFFINNLNYDISLMDYEKNPNLVIHSVRCSYRVRSEHLADKNRTYPLKYYYEISVPKEFDLAKEKFLRNFHIRINGLEFNKEDVVINRKSIGTIDAITITFDKTFKINEYSDVLLEIETLSSKNINDEVFITRYPTNGYKVTLRYSKEYEFDSCWFNSIQRKDMSELNSEQQIAYPDGISVMTNDWILPGNGVSLCWYHKNNFA